MNEFVATWMPLVGLVPVWLVAVLAPGMLVARRLKWGPVERLCAAVGVSLFLLYLGALATYLLGLGRGAYVVMAAGSVASAVWCWRDWISLWRMRSVRRAVGMVGVMLLWGTMCVALVRHYSGGGWSYDWGVHFMKVKAFVNGAPPAMADVRELIIDRPSMMNLVCAYLCGLLGQRFEVFQLAFVWLNVLPVLPCCLMVRRFSGGSEGGRRVWMLAAMLVCLPVLWANVTYTWTKLLAAYYIILGMWLYLRALDKGAGERVRMVAAFASMATGVLIHYSALPYGAAVFGHYLLLAWRGRGPGRWRESALVVGLGIAVLLTWFGWTTARYGVAEMATANNTLRHAGDETTRQWARKVGMNFVWSVVPHPLRTPLEALEQEDTVGYARDYVFLLYQTNLLLVTGSVTGVVAAWLMWSARTRAAPRERWFWWGLIAFLPVAAALAVDVPSPDGLAHLFFHAWAMLAVVVVAARAASLKRWVRVTLGLGLAVDFLLGVMLHLHAERLVFDISGSKIITHGRAIYGAMNWWSKVRLGWVFVGDHLDGIGWIVEALLLSGGLTAAWVVARGWKPRGGQRCNLDTGGEVDKIPD